MARRQILSLSERESLLALPDDELTLTRMAYYSVVGSIHWSNAEDTGALLWPSPPIMQGCAGHHCITVMISDCTQPAKARSNSMTI